MAPSGFEYFPTRIEDRDDSSSFIESTVFQACYARDIIVGYINHQTFVRSTYNIIRNSESVNNSDGNVIHCTVV